MSPSAILVWIVGGAAGLLLAALLVVDLPGDAQPAETPPILSEVRQFSSKPCHDCGASSIRVAPSDNMNRCHVCGCEFISAD